MMSKMTKIEAILFVMCSLAIIMVGYEVIDIQTQANEEFVGDCNEKFGEGNWITRPATWEERCNVSMFPNACKVCRGYWFCYIGDMEVCILKDDSNK